MYYLCYALTKESNHSNIHCHVQKMRRMRRCHAVCTPVHDRQTTKSTLTSLGRGLLMHVRPNNLQCALSMHIWMVQPNVFNVHSLHTYFVWCSQISQEQVLQLINVIKDIVSFNPASYMRLHMSLWILFLLLAVVSGIAGLWWFGKFSAYYVPALIQKIVL